MVFFQVQCWSSHIFPFCLIVINPNVSENIHISSEGRVVEETVGKEIETIGKDIEAKMKVLKNFPLPSPGTTSINEISEPKSIKKLRDGFNLMNIKGN